MSSWDLSEFDGHLRSLERVTSEYNAARSTASGIGGGNLYIYGLLVGPIATPIMNGVVDDFDELLSGLSDALESAQEGIALTRQINHEAEQNNADLSASVEYSIETTNNDVGRSL